MPSKPIKQPAAVAPIITKPKKRKKRFPQRDGLKRVAQTAYKSVI